MKKIALFSAIALCSTAAMGAESDDKAKNAQAEADKACCEAKCSPKSACGDEECWLDVETITVEAANGDPIAQYTIAWLTDNGVNNVPQDPEKAKEMYSKALPGLEKAAESGDASACCALANMYAYGKGVNKDEAKAKAWMERCKQIMKEKKDAAADKAAPAPAPAAK